MPETYEQVIGAALSLPPGARAMLAEHLLEGTILVIAVMHLHRKPDYWADRIE